MHVGLALLVIHVQMTMLIVTRQIDVRGRRRGRKLDLFDNVVVRRDVVDLGQLAQSFSAGLERELREVLVHIRNGINRCAGAASDWRRELAGHFG